jgi:hypothetical protein
MLAMSKTSKHGNIKKRGRGRPKVDGLVPLTKNLTVRMTEPEYNRLENGIGENARGKFVRKAIADALQDAGL